MPIGRRTVCVLAALCALAGTFAVTASAQADPLPPTITSIAVNGSDLTTDAVGNYYTNDPIDSVIGLTTDPFTVTVAGDPTGSSIDLVYDGIGLPSQTPDPSGDATFTIPPSRPLHAAATTRSRSRRR